MEDYDHSSLHEIQTQEMDEINFDVLHPENPLMIRFQNALSQMLEKKLGDLQDDLNEVVNIFCNTFTVEFVLIGIGKVTQKLKSNT